MKGMGDKGNKRDGWDNEGVTIGTRGYKINKVNKYNMQHREALSQTKLEIEQKDSI
jgi:hypothetical protein